MVDHVIKRVDDAGRIIALDGFLARDNRDAIMRDERGNFMRSVPFDEDGSQLLEGDEAALDGMNWLWVDDPTPAYHRDNVDWNTKQRIDSMVAKLSDGWHSNECLELHRLTLPNVKSVLMRNRTIETITSDGTWETVSRTSEHVGPMDDIEGYCFTKFSAESDNDVIDNVMRGTDDSKRTWFIASRGFEDALKSLLPEQSSPTHATNLIDLSIDASAASIVQPSAPLFSSTPLMPIMQNEEVASHAQPTFMIDDDDDGDVFEEDTIGNGPGTLAASMSVSIDNAYVWHSHELMLDVSFVGPDHMASLFKTDNTMITRTVFDGTIDIGVSNAPYCMSVDAISNVNMKGVRIPLPKSQTKLEDEPLYNVGDYVIVAYRVSTVTTNGTPKAEAHGGYGLVEVRKLLENSFAMVPIRYEHWDSMLGTVLLQNPRLVARGSDQQVPIHVHSSSELDSYKKQSDAMSESFMKSVQRMAAIRFNVFEYKPMPQLSKMWTPVISGTTYLSAINSTHSSMNADQLEEMLKSMLLHAAHGDKSRVDAMVEEDAVKPSLEYSEQFATLAADALHLVVRLRSYREDMAIVQTPLGELQKVAIDSFDHSPGPNPCQSAEDCDGSTNEYVRVARQLGLAPYGTYNQQGEFISNDLGYQPDVHVYTSAIRDALFHTVVATSIVSAFSGLGTQIEEGSTRLAGHMTGLLIDIPNAHNALVRGLATRIALRSSGRDDPNSDPKQTGTDQKSVFDQVDSASQTLSIKEAEQLYANALMPKERLMALPLEERPRGNDSRSWIRSLTSGIRTNEPMHPVALDGTVTSAIHMYVNDEETLLEDMDAVKHRNGIMSRLGPLPSIEAEVDLTGANTDGKHMFINELVEITMDVDTPQLRAACIAAHSFCAVYYNTEKNSIAIASGVTPKDLHNGDFALVANDWFDTNRGDMYDLLLSRVKQQTIPMRYPEPKTQHPTHSKVDNTNSINSLNALTSMQTKIGSPQDHTYNPSDTLVLHVPPRSMWAAPGAISHLCKRLENTASAVRVLATKMESLGEGACHVSIHVLT